MIKCISVPASQKSKVQIYGKSPVKTDAEGCGEWVRRRFAPMPGNCERLFSLIMKNPYFAFYINLFSTKN